MSDALNQMAAQHLQRVTEREPLYHPAKFTLGFLRLREGDTAEAERIFAGLTESYNKEAELRLAEAKERWPFVGLKYSFAVRSNLLRRMLLPWSRQWVHIRSLLLGGELHNAAKEWSELDERLDKLSKATGNFKAIEQASFDVYLDSFPKRAGIQKRARIAAGVEAGDRDKARDTLDWFLSSEKIEAVDWLAQKLEFALTTARFDSLTREPDTAAGKEQVPLPSELAELKQSDIVRSLNQLDQTVDDIAKCWQAEDWDQCARLLRDLRDLTRAPNDYEATRQFKAGLLPELGSGRRWVQRLREWHGRKHFPGFDLPELWRDTFRNGFFLESGYYLALCRYRTFTISGAHAAMKEAELLHTRMLAGVTPRGIDRRRYAELRLLSVCLEIDSVTRILLADDSDPVSKDAVFDARYRWNNLEAYVSSRRANIPPLLKRVADDVARAPGLRATALSTLGLAQRYQRKRIPVGRHEAMVAELLYYRRALNLDRSADACYYLAETLIEAERREEAQAYVDEAIRLCPRHAGALRLLPLLANAASEQQGGV